MLLFNGQKATRCEVMEYFVCYCKYSLKITRQYLVLGINFERVNLKELIMHWIEYERYDGWFWKFIRIVVRWA